MFYRDQKYIGARRPYDYPDDIHFGRKYVVEDNILEFYERATSPSDFSEYKSSQVNNPLVDYGYGDTMGGLVDSIVTPIKNNKLYFAGALALVGFVYYYTKVKKA